MIEETAMQGGCPARAGNVPLPLDRSLPRTARYEEGVAVTHVQASASARRSACCAFLSFLVRALQPELACLYGDGLGRLGDARLQCTGGRVEPARRMGDLPPAGFKSGSLGSPVRVEAFRLPAVRPSPRPR